MFKNVLVGIDGGPHGRDAAALASSLLARGGTMTLVHVHPGALRPTTAITPGLAREEEAASMELLERERTASGVEAQLASVLATSPGRGLHEEAERQRADLLVVGSCSRGRSGRVFIGDDARAAMNGAPCAVAIAARELSQRAPLLARIAVGYDGSPESEAALLAARELAAADGARIIALESVSPQVYGPVGLGAPIVDNTAALIEEAELRLDALVGVERRAVPGLAGDELAVLSGEVDLIVVGSRGYGPVRRIVHGSTSNYLERHARCSLLVVPRTTASPAISTRAA
jgi:nucleotide-binding universal stress UspA family protein